MRIANLVEYKEKNRLSSRDMARELGISESYLSEVLSGQKTPSKKLARRISEKTGIPILNLLFPQAGPSEQQLVERG